MDDILIITNKYPNKYEPNILVFLQQLAWQFADMNYKVRVIAPNPVNLNLKHFKLPYHSTEVTENGATIDVYRPKYIGFGQKKILNIISFAHLTTHLFTKSIKRVLKKHTSNNPILYSHFAVPAGIAAATLGEKMKLKSYMAYGEATTKTLENYGISSAIKKLDKLTGIVSVSTYNKKKLLLNGFKYNEKIKVFPNGFRPERFYRRNKMESRKMFDLPKDKFIVSFVGSFDDRKGIKRLEKAIEELDDVYFIAAGKGDMNPTSSKCLYYGPVNHDNLPYFYSASDLFVLPTKDEGSCNAIIEAKAIGLPIISSNLEFNSDILNSSNSILIDPNNIEDIKKSILKVFLDSNMRDKLSKKSLEDSKRLRLEIRAKGILDFIK